MSRGDRRHDRWVLVLLALGWSSPAAGDFIRGDANRDGRVNVTDAVTQIVALFHDARPLTCRDAADSNDDGQLDVSDALATLLYVFADGELPYPGPTVSGPDPTCDRLGCPDSDVTTPAIVLSEIHYNPLDQRAEFVELRNRSGADIDVGGYAFTSGIRFVIPTDTVLTAGGFLLVARDPAWRFWRDHPTPPLGPFELVLSDRGERVTLVDGDCLVETVRYDDRAPWPTGPDGSGRSLERVDVLAPSDDYHSWRTSFPEDGTPGAENSTREIPTHPTIVSFATRPAQPTSRDPARVTIELDSPPEDISRVTLHWERVADTLSTPESVEMALDTSDDAASDGARYLATVPPGPSQSMTRCALEVELRDGSVVRLPHPAEPAPVLTYFVYDGEIQAKLPILWAYPPRRSGIVPGRPSLSGVVAREVASDVPVVFDGAEIRGSNQGFKVTFLKGAEYRGDRTLNVLPERGGEAVVGGRGGPYAPHFEHFGYETYRDLGALAPEARWFRLLLFGTSTGKHTQRVVFEQVNERFFEKNGLDPDGDLYKHEHSSFSKRTNLETGTLRLTALLRELSSNDPERVRAAVLDHLDLDSFRRHSAVSVLIGHGDNYTNNLFIYHDLSPAGRWKVIPWDLDTILQQPLSPEAPAAGTLSGPYLAQDDLNREYREFLRSQIAPGGRFTVDVIEERCRAIESLLLEDLELLERQLGAELPSRREQIRGAYAEIRTKTRENIAFLSARLR